MLNGPRKTTAFIDMIQNVINNMFSIKTNLISINCSWYLKQFIRIVVPFGLFSKSYVPDGAECQDTETPRRLGGVGSWVPTI